MNFKDFYDYYDYLSYMLRKQEWSEAEIVADCFSIKDSHSDYSFLQVECHK